MLYKSLFKSCSSVSLVFVLPKILTTGCQRELAMVPNIGGGTKIQLEACGVGAQWATIMWQKLPMLGTTPMYIR